MSAIFPVLDSTLKNDEMSDRENESKKVLVDFCRTKRSLEYIHQYEGERAWWRLKRAIARKRQRRRIVYSGSVAAVLAISFTIFYLWEGTDIRSEKKILAECQEKIEGDRSTGVVLSLSDGSRVDLSANDGQVLPGTGIVNYLENRQLVYASDRERGKDSCFNRLDVPSGAEYHLILSDGTKVWVNSASQLVYPEFFGDSREVKLKGEAYFEVIHDAARPFIVHADGMAVRVLGTEFNVNTCRGQGEQTVLVKGKVEVDGGGGRKVVLKPGELAELTGGEIEVKQVNVRKYVAWRYGEFYFENATLGEIMTELSSWYGVRFVFINQSLRERRFSGVLKRGEAVRDVLRKIEQTSSVRFSVQNEMIKVE